MLCLIYAFHSPFLGSMDHRENGRLFLRYFYVGTAEVCAAVVLNHLFDLTVALLITASVSILF